MRRIIIHSGSFFVKLFFLIFFVCFALYFIFIKNQYESFSTINVDQQTGDIIYHTENLGKPLYSHNKITGEFTAAEDYLGIMQFRFDTFQRINTDWLIFRLKEKGNSQWQVVNKYKTDQFVWNNAYFPFGFPVIVNSKGKRFEFSIESLYGKRDDSVAVSNKTPIFITQYVFPLHTIIHRPTTFLYFLMKKILFVFNEKVFLPVAFLDFMPLLIYLELIIDISGLRVGTKIIHLLGISKKHVIIFSNIIGFIIYLFFIDKITDSILLIQLFMWISLLLVSKSSSSKTFLSALCLLLLLPIFIIINQTIIADRLAYTIYMLLFVGIIQEICAYTSLKKYIPKIAYEK